MQRRIPEPLSPNIGFGIKVVFTETVRNVVHDVFVDLNRPLFGHGVKAGRDFVLASVTSW